MKYSSAIIIFVLLSIVLHSCGSKETPVALPGTVVLTSPADNEACLKSSSTIDGVGAVAFSWNAASDADSYRLDIKNLNTQTIKSFTSNKNSYTASLEVNIPYSWSVTAINSAGATTSPSQKFFFSGTAMSNYAPFPAELVSPALQAIISASGASSVAVTLQWTGSDPDNDIQSYAVYLDSKDATTVVAESQSGTSFSLNLLAGKTYFWKVITKDKTGNTSVSNINSFQVK